MRPERSFLLGALLALAVAVFPGCAGRMGPPPDALSPQPFALPDVPSAPPDAPCPPPPPEARTALSAAERAYVDGMGALQEKENERALGLFSAALKEEPAFPDASRGFDEALVALKKEGDSANAQGKAEEAGRRWMETLRHFGSPAARGKTYPFTRAELQGQVARLTAAQMEKGLLLYRKGEIPSAIAAWKKILAYDPENEEAARSIRTASTQYENLKKIPPAR